MRFKLLIFFLISFLVNGQSFKNKKLALVIGNSNYTKGELKNPVNDALLIAKTLDSLHFDVILKTNLETDRSLKLAIREFGSRRNDYDIAFVYYAGHGIQVGNENFLLPTKQEFSSEDDVLDFAVSVQTIMKYLEGEEDKINILILDACRDNPFESNWNKTRSLKGKGLAKIPAPTGSLIAFSTDAGNVAPDGEGDNSVYSTSLSKNMLLVDTSIDQIFRNVRAEVLKISNGMQRPVEETQLTGKTFFLNPSDFTQELEEIKLVIEEEIETKYQDALLILENILTKYPENSEANYLKGRLFLRTKEYDSAINHYNNLLDKFGEKTDYYLELFKNYYVKGDNDNALLYVNKAIELDPLLPKNFWTRGFYYEEMGEMENALEDYNMGASLDSLDVNILSYRAALYKNHFKNAEEALNDYNQILAIEDKDNYIEKKWLYNQIGEVYTEISNDFEKAKASFDQAILLDANYSDALLNRAELNAYVFNSMHLALKDFEDAISADKKNHAAYYKRSEYYVWLDDFNKAYDDLTIALNINPTSMDYLFKRAYISQTYLEKFDQALSDYLTIVRLDKDYSFAKENYLYNDIALIYKNYIKDFNQALFYLNKEIELSPNESLGYISRANLLSNNLNEPKKALEDYDRAASLAPDNADIYSRRAKYHENQKKYQKSLDDYSKAISIDPTNKYHLFNRAVLLQNYFNNYELALKDYLSIEVLDKKKEFAESEYLYNNIAQLYRYRIKDNKSALTYYTKEIEISPQETLGYINRASFYLTELNDTEKALADYNKAIALEKNNFEHFYYRAEVYEKMGKYQSAFKDYSTAIELNPDDIYSLFSRALLAQGELMDYDSALADYLRIERLDKDNSFAKENFLNNNIGLLFRDYLNDYNKALHYYNKEIELSPEEGLGFANRAELFANYINEPEKALKDYNKAIEIDPDNAYYLYLRGLYHMANENYSNAISDFESAYNLSPEENLNYLSPKADILIIQKKYIEAKNVYLNSISFYLRKKEKGLDDLIYYYDRLIDLYELMIDFDGVLEYVSKIFEIHDNQKKLSSDFLSSIYVKKGDAYLNKNQNIKAKENYLKAISTDPKNRNPYFNLANYYIRTNDIKSAILTIEKTITMDYNDPDGYYKKALIYQKNQQLIKALISVSNSILKAEEENRLVNGDYYISDLNNISQISLADLYVFRAELYSSLGYEENACEDLYDSLLRANEIEARLSIQEKIENECRL